MQRSVVQIGVGAIRFLAVTQPDYILIHANIIMKIIRPFRNNSNSSDYAELKRNSGVYWWYLKSSSPSI